MASGEGTRGRFATPEVEKLPTVGQGHHGGTWGKQRLCMFMDEMQVPVLRPPTTREPTDVRQDPTPQVGHCIWVLLHSAEGPPSLVVSPGDDATPKAMQGAQVSCDTLLDWCPSTSPLPSSLGSHLLLQALQHGG